MRPRAPLPPSSRQVPAENPSGAGNPQWPRRLAALADRLGKDLGPADREAMRGEAWLLLNSSLSNYLQRHAARYGHAPREELEDIAAEKALDLLRRIESGTWDLSGRLVGEIHRFLSQVARNGLIDYFRRAGREVPADGDGRPAWEEESRGGLEITDPGSAVSAPDARVERHEFVRTLSECSRRLQLRSRRAWFFRVFYGMSTREIAAHPDIGLNPGHVDVILQRARETIRECMRSRGFDTHEMPPGTFVALWQALGEAAGPLEQGR
ncbi:MAG: sigma-70 family RNA polymerase sigma factor [Candidatus Eisenbacteria bacterium]|nr:sigma-70 family RNA polymerase sigma factor [Candidatus Eisenbacteria bacterium]